jgi:predicted outer membrane repeat protein
MATGPSYSVYQVADLSQQADLSKQQADADRSAQDASKQVTENTRYCGPDNGMPLALANSGDKGGGAIYSTQLTTDKTTGAASIGLANPLQSDTYICVAQVPTTAQVVPSNARLVIDPFDLGRVRLYFTSGVLVANDDATAQNTTGSSFSTAHTFLALTMDSDFLLPGCYLRIYANHTDTGICEHKRNVYGNTFRPPPLGNPRNQDDIANLNGTHVPPPPPGTNTWFTPYGWWGRHHPGVNQFFEARLTAIPVSSTSTPSTNTPTTPTTGTSLRFASSPGGGLSLNGAAAAPAATSASSGTSTSSFLTTQTTARLDAGVYFPILLTRWDWGGDANSLFFAPLTKIGFDTLTGPTSQTVTAANGMGTTTLSLENLYKFDGFGARIGHMSLTKTNRHAPETLSYLDVTIGRFSNLNSYICHPSATTSMLTGSSCVAQYGAGNYADSLKRMYRVDFEGLLKVPKTPLVLGFNANIGQEEIGAQKLDHAFQPPDDLRFLFGTKLDLSTLLSKINLGSASQKK